MNNATVDTTTVKFHTSLNVSNLDRSIEFYRALFGVEAAKCRPDYAKFELDEPPLVLSLIPGRAAPGGNLNHVGMRLSNAADLVKVQHRLEAAGIRTQREEGVECCYAKQTKFWVTDPDRALWEIYIFHEDIDEHGHGSVPEVNQVESFAKNVERVKLSWQHQLGETIPLRIPHDENSVHEVLLEGTANTKPGATSLEPLLKDCFRVLRPGAEVRIHGLSADRPLGDGPLDLPGPAAKVQYTPTVTELVDALRNCGFAAVRVEKLSEKPYFKKGAVGLREVLVVGRKPGFRPGKLSHVAVYLGPMASIIDGFGNVFTVGTHTLLNIHDWQVLKHGPESSQFVFIAPDEAGNG